MSTNCRLEPKDPSQGSAGDNIDISAQDIQRSCEEANVAGFSNELDDMPPDLKVVVVAGTALVRALVSAVIMFRKSEYIYASNRFEALDVHVRFHHAAIKGCYAIRM